MQLCSVAHFSVIKIRMGAISSAVHIEITSCKLPSLVEGTRTEQKVNTAKMSSSWLLMVHKLSFKKRLPACCPVFHLILCQSIIPYIHVTCLVCKSYLELVQNGRSQGFGVNFRIVWVNICCKAILLKKDKWTWHFMPQVIYISHCVVRSVMGFYTTVTDPITAMGVADTVGPCC